MPGISGLDFLRRVKETHHDVPIIVMTAHSDLQSAVTSFERGAFEYLPKPFDVDEAVAVVRRAIAQTQDVKSVADRASRHNGNHRPGTRHAGSVSGYRAPVFLQRNGID